MIKNLARVLFLEHRCGPAFKPRLEFIHTCTYKAINTALKSELDVSGDALFPSL